MLTQGNGKRASLLMLISITLLFISIPAVLFAGNSTPIYQGDDTVITRTPSSKFLPLVVRQSTPTPLPTAAFTPTPEATETPIRTCFPNPPLDPNNIGIESLLRIEINEQRSANGSLAGYTINDQLVQAARRHVINMGSLVDSQLNADPHIGTDGTNAVTRIEEACYDGSRGSEIVGWGWTTLEQMMDWWMNSNVHRNTILSTDLDEYGPSYANLDGTQYTHYWTVTFGSSTTSRVTKPAYVCTYTVVVEKNKGVSATVWQETPCGQ